jgi:hypothetical protein
MVILEAIRRAGKPTGDLKADRDRIRTALESTDMSLTQGRVKFDARGQVVTVKPYVVQVKLAGGEPTLSIVYPPEKATTPYAPPLPWEKR